MVAAIETRTNRDAGSAAFQPHAVPGHETRPANGGTVVLEAPGMPEGFVVTDARRAGGVARLVLPDGWTVTDERRAIGKPGKASRKVSGGHKPCPGIGQGCTRHIPAAHGLCTVCNRDRINARYGVTDGKVPAAMAGAHRAANAAAIKSGEWTDF